MFYVPVNNIYQFCIIFRRKRRTKRKDPRHFAHHQLSPHSDSSLSKHSTLSQPDPRMVDPRDPRLIDPRLPKVGSSNLWFGTPSLYSGGPSEAYQGVRKTSNNRPPPPSQPTLQGECYCSRCAVLKNLDGGIK